jgi:hypothetical protein
MSKSKIIPLAALITIAILVSVTQTWAATMKFRVVFFHTKVELIEVGDVEGHIIGVGQSTGLATLESGEVAVLGIKWNVDYTKGAGQTDGYWHLTFEDGSTFDMKGRATARPDPKGDGTLFEGTTELYQGSGRYAGIQGKSTVTGRRIQMLGAGAQVYFDFVLTYTFS